MKENDIYEKITYKQGIPYYMGMPCFLDGKKLNSKPKIDKDGFLSAYYWRDAGLWGCTMSEIFPDTFAYNDGSPWHLYLCEAKPMTFDEWKKDNDPYCLRFSNVIEALTLKGQ